MPKTYNKFVIGDTTYLDLSNDTVDTDKLLEGYTAHDKNGESITGTYIGTQFTGEIIGSYSGVSTSAYVTYNDVEYYTVGDTFDYSPGDTLHVYLGYAYYVQISVNDVVVASKDGGSTRTFVEYDYILPKSDIKIQIVARNTSLRYIYIYTSPYLIEKTITSNGTYNASSDGADGYSTVTVNTQSLVVTDTLDSHGGTIREITGKVIDLKTKSITQNGTYDAEDDNCDGYSSVTVDVGGSSPTIESLSVMPSTSQQTFNSSSVDGYKPVVVDAMPSGSATAAASISGTSATVSTGTNTLTLSKTVSNTPQVTAGYISSGTAGNSSVSLTAYVTTKAAATITPGTSNQTIASGTYLTGTQTISGDSDLIASNIKKDVQIFGVTGTYEGSGGGGMNTQVWIGRATRQANSYGATDATLTVAKTGTYTVSWSAWRSSSSGTMGTNLHVNDTAGTNQQTFTNTYGQQIQLTGQNYNAGDVLTIYATSGSNSRILTVANLIIVQTS